MKKENVDSMLSNMDVPRVPDIKHQQELKIPLLSYRKSSKAGMWLLILPVMFPLVMFLKYQLGLDSSLLGVVETLFKGIAGNEVLAYLIPVIFVGLPLFAMIANLLAFCHFASNKETNELLVTIKYRPLNFVIFLLSFAILAYAFLPDSLP